MKPVPILHTYTQRSPCEGSQRDIVSQERLKTRHCEGNCHVYSVVHTVVKRQQTYKPQAETIPNYVIPVPYHYVYCTTRSSTILVVLLVLLDCTLVLSVLVLLVLFTSPAASILHLFRGNIVPAFRSNRCSIRLPPSAIINY